MLSRRAFWSAVFLCALSMSGGCATQPLGRMSIAEVQAQPRLELSDTPFFPQEIHQCGPAAMATVLNAAGVEIAPETLADQVYIPGREGTLQAELIAAVRSHDRVAVHLSPTIDALLAPLAEGRPVLLLQNLGLKSLPAWHYAVLVGWDASRDEFVLRSGRRKRERLSSDRFVETWELGGRWAVVIADPSQPPPASVQAVDWITAIAPLESLGQNDLARKAYESAAERWPDQSVVWQALANARYADHDLPGAQQALESAASLDPSAAALNNLAQVRIERGCTAQALAALERIGEVPPILQAAVADTRAAAQKAGNTTAVDCR